MAKPIAKSATLPSAVMEVKTEAVAVWQHGAMPDGVASGAISLAVGGDTGRKDKSNNPILSRSLVIRTPNTRETGLTGDAALQKQREVGEAIKPTVMGRVSAFSNRAGVIVRRYVETPNPKSGRNKMQLTLESISVESTIAKLAREYNLTEEEVRKRLNIPLTTEVPAISV